MNEIVLLDAASGTRATVVPERGGMVTGLEVRGRRVLFMDDATLRDPTKNVRGGVPILFPSPGKLENDAWTRDGAGGSLKQHGFARNLPWTVAAQDASSVTLTLASSDATRADYPWDFRVALVHRVSDGALALEARITSTSERPMPFGFGTHGYFAIADRSTFRFASRATRALDNVTKREVPFDAATLRLGETEIDLHLLDHDATRASFEVDGVPIAIEAPDHRRWVLWSPPGKRFVCVEPWTCPGNALNTGVDLIALAPGETRTLTQTFRVG